MKLVNPWVIFTADLFWGVLSTYIAVLLVAYVNCYVCNFVQILEVLGISFLSSVVSIRLCKTYLGIIRQSTIIETGRIILASLIKVVFIFIAMKIIEPVVPGRILLVAVLFDLLLTSFFFTAFRLFLIVFYRMASINQGVIEDKMVIYTGDRRFISLTGEIFSNLGAYTIEGYLRIGKNGILRSGIYPEYSVQDFEDFSRLVSTKKINCVLFVDRRDIDNEKERLVRFCEHLKLRMLLLPSVDEVIDGKLSYRHFPEVRIEDLLGRDVIKINMEEIAKELRGKVIMVTGAAGSIGSELCRKLCTFDIKSLVLFDAAETPMHNIRLELEEKFPHVHIIPLIGDVRIQARLRYTFETYHPQVIFHAAAYKHVPLMEENPCEAVRTNVFGTRNLADMAVEFGVERFVMISTDKAVNPTNVMGATKRMAEIYVQSLSIAIGKGLIKGKTKFITTRFGNVLGSNGSVIPLFRQQLLKGGPLTVTHPDIIRYFMTIPEACSLVLEAAVMGAGNEIFVFDMGEPVKIAYLAKRMIELAGLVPGKDIDIVYTGLRPGEKLYEELLATKENTLPTPNEKIFRAHVREYNYADVEKEVAQLSEEALTMNSVNTVRKMKEIIPEFKSNNSEFAVLDK